MTTVQHGGYVGTVARMAIGAGLCLFVVTGCASMGALMGAPYKKDSVDKFHGSAKGLYDAVNGTKSELRGVRKSIGQNLADGSPPTMQEIAEYIQRVSRISKNIKKALASVQDKLAMMDPGERLYLGQWWISIYLV